MRVMVETFKPGWRAQADARRGGATLRGPLNPLQPLEQITASGGRRSGRADCHPSPSAPSASGGQTAYDVLSMRVAT